MPMADVLRSTRLMSTGALRSLMAESGAGVTSSTVAGRLELCRCCRLSMTCEAHSSGSTESEIASSSQVWMASTVWLFRVQPGHSPAVGRCRLADLGLSGLLSDESSPPRDLDLRVLKDLQLVVYPLS